MTGDIPGDAAPGVPADAAAAAGASPFASLEGQNGAPGPAAHAAGEADAIATARLDLVFEVPVCLSVELGRTEVPIRDVVNLGRGSIIELDRGPGTPLDVRVNGVLIGRGEVVLVNEERLGLRFVEVVSQAERVKRLG
ncbi:MAG TPA: flagellar motor switch protein FliN [Stellaceae bacterium]|nr:flagellar motor switch protein FliN [Stellaceae bacterium]